MEEAGAIGRRVAHARKLRRLTQVGLAGVHTFPRAWSLRWDPGTSRPRPRWSRACQPRWTST